MNRSMTRLDNRIEVNNNNSSKSNSRMNCRKQSATWKDRVLTVQLLNKQNIQINVQPKVRYRDILQQLCTQLGLTELEIFGLAFKSDQSEFRFLDEDSRVCKRLFSLPSQSNEHGEIKPHLYLRVQYYVESGHCFRTDADRKYYFQQLKENFLRYGFNYPDDRCFLLASYAIHADELNWRKFDPREYFPAWVLKRYGTHFMRRHMPTIMPERITALQAMNTYIKELCTPAPHAYNIKMHRLQSCKSKDANDTRLGIGYQGLEVYEVNLEGYLNFLTSCQWREIRSITTNKRRIEINLFTRTLNFYTSNENDSRALAHNIRCSQVYYMGGPDVSHDLSDSSLDDLSFRESYIYSDENDMEWEYEQSILGTLPSSKSSQAHLKAVAHSTPQSNLEYPHNRNRFSIVSTSTMTSGIVSDRTCLSTENSQEDLLSTSNCGTRQPSCDSLLETKESRFYKNPAVTVQRAISEPSKKFEQLRFQVRHLPQCFPRRAVSDETVDDHDYENVAVIRQTLGMVDPAKRRTASSTSQQFSNRSPVMSGHSSPVCNLSQPSSSRKTSLSSVNKLHSAILSQPRYSLISTSPSMEKLLIDYTPPPSYNEAHAKQRQILLAASRSNSHDSTTSLNVPLTSSITGPIHSASTSLTSEGSGGNKLYQKRQSSVPYGDAENSNSTLQIGYSTAHKCNCQKLSHPEIDKLRTDIKDLMSLPMISALCNDKELQRTANECHCRKYEPLPPSPRPISWHCESPQTFTFPSLNEKTSQACH